MSLDLYPTIIDLVPAFVAGMSLVCTGAATFIVYRALRLDQGYVFDPQAAAMVDQLEAILEARRGRNVYSDRSDDATACMRQSSDQAFRFQQDMSLYSSGASPVVPGIF